MSEFQFIRIYADRARRGASGFAAPAPGPLRLLLLLLAIPLALLLLLTGVVAFVFVAALVMTRGLVLRARAKLAPLGTGSSPTTPWRTDGRRNVRVIRPPDGVN